MIHLPSSLRARLLTLTFLWVALGIVGIGISASFLFRHHVVAQFHDELDVHLVELQQLTRIDGSGQPVLMRPLSDPRFNQRSSGYYWQVSREGFPALRSGSLESSRLVMEMAPQSRVVRGMASGPGGEAIAHGIVHPIESGGPLLHFVLATDQSELDKVVHSFDRALLWWLVGLVAAMLLSGFALVSIGLAPLKRINRAVADIRSGRSERMEGKFPSEVGPLVADLNMLLDNSREHVRQARLQAGNLAHGLRTPLAILMDEAETQDGDDSSALQQCRRMQRQIDWHLARARAAALGRDVIAVTRLPEMLDPIVSAMRQLYGRRGVAFIVAGGPPAAIACEQEDFAEIVSSLIDNAGKWAVSEVRIDWTAEAGRLKLGIVDDGSGIPEDETERIFSAGERLDEITPGSGLGLAIARDLARIYGGDVSIGSPVPPGSGCRVFVTLPLSA